MFRADRGIIEPGGHGVSQFDLAFFVGEQKRFCSLKDAEPAALESRGVFPTANSFAARFDADHSNLSIFEEGMKQTDRIAAASDTGDQQIGQAFLARENLAPRFHANDALKIAH